MIGEGGGNHVVLTAARLPRVVPAPAAVAAYDHSWGEIPCDVCRAERSAAASAHSQRRDFGRQLRRPCTNCDRGADVNPRYSAVRPTGARRALIRPMRARLTGTL